MKDNKEKFLKELSTLMKKYEVEFDLRIDFENNEIVCEGFSDGNRKIVNKNESHFCVEFANVANVNDLVDITKIFKDY